MPASFGAAAVQSTTGSRQSGSDSSRTATARSYGVRTNGLPPTHSRRTSQSAGTASRANHIHVPPDEASSVAASATAGSTSQTDAGNPCEAVETGDVVERIRVAVTAAVRASSGRSCAAQAQHHAHGAYEDQEVEQQRPVLDVVQVVLELGQHLLLRRGVRHVHLRPAGQAGLDEQAAAEGCPLALQDGAD